MNISITCICNQSYNLNISNNILISQCNCFFYKYSNNMIIIRNIKNYPGVLFYIDTTNNTITNLFILFTFKYDTLNNNHPV